MQHDQKVDLTRASILILDSSAFTRSIAANILRGAGINKITECAAPEDAWEKVRDLDPTAIILEWEDGGLDGLEITRKVRAGEAGPNRAVPIILVTSRASIPDVERARMAGVTEYAVRPISAKALLGRVEQVLYRPRPFVVSDVYVGPCRRRSISPYFMGPFRRADDPQMDPNADPVEQNMKFRMSAHVGRLAFEAKGFLRGERSRVRFVISAAQSLRDTAREFKDAHIDTACQSLTRYLHAVGSDSRLDVSIVEMHIAALAQLVALPNAEGDLRHQVSQGLEKVVTKKLGGGRAAAR